MVFLLGILEAFSGSMKLRKLEMTPKRVQCLRTNSYGRALCGERLEGASDFVNVFEVLPCEATHHHTSARRWHHQTFHFESAKSFAQRSAANVQGRGDILLGDLLVLPEPSFQNGCAQGSEYPILQRSVALARQQVRELGVRHPVLYHTRSACAVLACQASQPSS